MTRAKCFLYCTFAQTRMVWGNAQYGSLSEFLSDMPQTAYTRRTPKLDSEARAWVADVLRLPYRENCTLQHAGDGIWMDEERQWSKCDSDKAESGYASNRRNYSPYSRNGFNSASYSSRGGRSGAFGLKGNRSGATTTMTATPRPKATAQSVQSKPYASFGSAAFVKEDVISDYKKTTNVSDNKSEASFKRKREYGVGTAHLRKN
ncbi:hypothetical protein BDB00DRAFT_26291 [Zychaea mexicana]|uniref:uncharacterized protein n=1 Tax=Zychaea mexicana TaxID=64656 RepID=UPI0022FF0C20|nr:uncharacterized protein BDB00DRAFT_26291 [Zychaea mexicana]KAI9488854.1 hypothetical protein BDB00DRAFT_26291 [Zychaea mexicana]